MKTKLIAAIVIATICAGGGVLAFRAFKPPILTSGDTFTLSEDTVGFVYAQDLVNFMEIRATSGMGLAVEYFLDNDDHAKLIRSGKTITFMEWFPECRAIRVRIPGDTRSFYVPSESLAALNPVPGSLPPSPRSPESPSPGQHDG